MATSIWRDTASACKIWSAPSHAPKLVDLRLAKTKVTAEKIDELKAALPRCRIEWDGGIIEPRSSDDTGRPPAE
jgi:hypothetical protein